MMSQSDYEYESDGTRSRSSRGTSSKASRRQTAGGGGGSSSKASRRQTAGGAVSGGGGLERVQHPRRKPRNQDTSRMSAADLVFRNSYNDSTDTFSFSADEESDWITDLDESESENEAPPANSLLSVTKKAPKEFVKADSPKKIKPESFQKKIKPETQKIGGSESDWFSEFSESEAEFASQPPARSLLEKKKKTKGRTAGQAKREAEAKANSEENEKNDLKKKGKSSSRKPVKISKHVSGRASTHGEETEDDDDRSASQSVKSTTKRSKESAKRSSKRSSGDKQVEDVLTSSKTQNTRGRASNRGIDVEDDERSASRSVSVRRSKESSKRMPSAPLLDGSPTKTESTKTASKGPGKRESHRKIDEGRRGRSPSQSDIPFQIAIEDPADDMDAQYKEAKERIAQNSRRAPFCERVRDRSLSVSRHRVRDRSRSASRTRDGMRRSAADIPLVDDRDLAKRGESGRGYLPTAYDKKDHSPTALDRRKEHSYDDQSHGTKHDSDLTMKEAGGRLGKKPTDGYDSATSASRPSLDGLFSRRENYVLSGSASLSGAPGSRLISDSASLGGAASLGGEMRPTPGPEKSRRPKIDSLNWSGAMDNLLSERRQRPSTMESPAPQKKKLGSSDLLGSQQWSASKLDEDSLYDGMPARGGGINPMESSRSEEPRLVTSDRGPSLTRPQSSSRLNVDKLWEANPPTHPSLMSGALHDLADPAPRHVGHRLGAVMTTARKHTKSFSDISGISSGISVLNSGLNSGVSVLNSGVTVLSGGSHQPAGHSALGSPKRNKSGKSVAEKQPAKSPPKRNVNAAGHSRDADRRHPMHVGAPPLY